jgi:competence protein ComFC
MLNIFSKIYDTIFPRHEMVNKIKDEVPEQFIRHFSPHKFANCIALADYSNPMIRAAISANKFHDDKHAAILLSALLDRWLETSNNLPIIFVPIPLSPERERSRGYNQVTRVLQNLNTKIEVSEMLIRNKNTKPQTSLRREQRFDNIKEAFIFKQTKIDLTAKHIIIVDDVVTTGATMKAAQDTLSLYIKSDYKITYLALAH